jgi:hypothetical protein
MVLTEERHNKSAAHLRLIHEVGQSVLADILSSFDYMSPDEVLFVTFVVAELFKALNPPDDETIDYLVETDYYQNNYVVRLHSALNLLMSAIDLVVDKISEPSTHSPPMVSPPTSSPPSSASSTSPTATASASSVPAPAPVPVPAPAFPHEFNEANRHYYPSLYRINRRIRRHMRTSGGYMSVVEAFRVVLYVNDVVSVLNSRGHRLC